MKRDDRISSVAGLSLALILGVAALAPAPFEAGTRRDGELSKKLNAFAFYEEVADMWIAVDVRAARHTKKGTMFPLGVGLANLSRTPASLGRESFVLVDEDGVQYPVVSILEYVDGYKRSRADRRLGQEFDMAMETLFTSYTHTHWDPYPLRGGKDVTSTAVEIGMGYWTRGWLYFPIPETGLDSGDFKLLINTGRGAEQLVVRFSIN